MEAGTTIDLLTAIRTRRSIRRYQARPVSRRDLELIVDAARQAPSASNGQPWDFVAVSDPQTQRALVDLVLGAHTQFFSQVAREAMPLAQAENLTATTYSTLFNAPVFIVACLNRKRRMTADAFDAVSHRLDLVSIAAAIENLLLAATALGLGTCWMGAPGLREAEIRQLLGIPDAVEIVAVIPLGYPDESPEPRPRDEVAEILHYGRWGTAKPRPVQTAGYGDLLSSPAPAPAASPASAADFISRGAQAFAEGDFARAVADFDEAVRREPSLAVAWRNRAAAHFCLGQYLLAMDDYSQALALSRADAESYYYRGLAARALGRHHDAIADFTRAIEAGFSSPTVHYSRGAAYVALGAIDQGRADLDRFLAASTDPQARAAVDQLLGRQGP